MSSRCAIVILTLSFFVSCGGVYDGDADETTPALESALSTGSILGASLPAKTLALTFDDGPSDRTIELSSYLKSHGIRATFFIVGREVPGRQGALAAIVADGHLLANHTQNHVNLTTVGASQVVSELSQLDAILQPYIPGGPFLFRAPFLAWNGSSFNAAQASTMKKYIGPLSADIGTQLTATAAADWACWQQTSLTTAQCGDRYLQEIERVGRGFVLMHDPYGSAFGNTVDMVKYLVPRLETRGYKFARADEVPDVAAQLPKPPAAGGITIAHGESVGGYVSEVFRWRDSAQRERSAALVRNDAQDPMGHFGGYLRRFTYVKPNGQSLIATGSNQNYPGWGYTASHQRGDDPTTVSSRFAPGTYLTRFAGTHHAIHEYRWTAQYAGGPVSITVQWVFATGRDHPLWTATFDSSGAAPNAIDADHRSPAGLLHWDGGADGTGSVVSGVGWGDRFKFRTTSTPESMSSAWTYAASNRIPYVWMWSTSTDTEMGAVQTQHWQRRDAGYGWLYPNWGRTSANKVISTGTPSTQRMPVDWNWTYQLNQYELPDARNKRMAWGMNYGAIGQTSYPAYGDDRTLSGYPYQSHSVFMVMGARSGAAVTNYVTQVERTIASRLTATRGNVRTSGPGGVGRADSVPFSPPGWSSVYATWDVTATASSGVTMTIDTKGQSLDRPMFRLHGYKAAVPATITMGGVTLTRDVDFFASLDGSGQTLWLTVNRAVTGVVTIVVN